MTETITYLKRVKEAAIYYKETKQSYLLTLIKTHGLRYRLKVLAGQ